MTKFDLSTIDVLSELDAELQQISPELVAYRSKRLPKIKKGETILGVIDKPALQALFCITAILKARAARTAADSANATSEQEENDKLHSASRDSILHQMTDEIFWAQVRRELDNYDHDTIGMRAGWQVVAVPSEHPLQALLERLQGG